MNNKPNYKKGKRKEIIEIALHTGGIPIKDIPLYSTKVECMRKQMMIMETEGTLRKVKTDLGYVDIISSYSDKIRNESTINDKYKKYYEAYGIVDSYKLAGDVDQGRTRLYRQAEAFIFMYGAGVKCKIGDKPSMFNDNRLDGYYTAREIKGNIEEANKAVSGVRTTGLVVFKSGAYTVYDANKEVLKFGKEDAMKWKIENDILKSKNIECLKGAILLTESFATQKKYINPKSDNREWSSNLFDAYDHIYAVNLDVDGQRMIRVMEREDWDKKTYEMLLSDKPAPINDAVTCDGKDDTSYYFVYCVPDINRFKEFVKAAEFFNNPSKFKIICFDTQTEFVKSLAGNFSTIYEVSFSEYLQEMGVE